SREGITSAKLEILQGLKNEGLYVFDGDEPLLKNRYIKHKYISCGFTADSKYEIEEVQIDNQGTAFSVNGESYKTSLIGKHHAKNASYAIAIAKSLGLNMEMIQKGLNQIDTTAMRFEVLVGQNDVLLINDAYNASVVSMKGAILTVKDLYINKKKVLV